MKETINFCRNLIEYNQHNYLFLIHILYLVAFLLFVSIFYYDTIGTIKRDISQPLIILDLFIPTFYFTKRIPIWLHT
jgi:hypothetical protein